MFIAGVELGTFFVVVEVELPVFPDSFPCLADNMPPSFLVGDCGVAVLLVFSCFISVSEL